MMTWRHHQTLTVASAGVEGELASKRVSRGSGVGEGGEWPGNAGEQATEREGARDLELAVEAWCEQNAACRMPRSWVSGAPHTRHTQPPVSQPPGGAAGAGGPWEQGPRARRRAACISQFCFITFVYKIFEISDLNFLRYTLDKLVSIAPSVFH
jgi:hypothetical protein